MKARRWTREEIGAFVEGSAVQLRSADFKDLDVPGWLADAAGAVGLIAANRRMLLTHPDDRTKVSTAFREARLDADQVTTAHYRIDVNGSWQHERLRVVNLIDHPEVGGMLLSVTVEVPATASPEPVPVPERAAPAPPSEGALWMVLMLDSSGTILQAEGGVEGLAGRTDTVGAHVLELVRPEGHSEVLDAWLEVLEHPGTVRTVRHQVDHRGGREVWFDAMIINRNDPETEAALLVVVQDVTVRRARELEIEAKQRELAAVPELRRLAERDALTGLLNRAGWELRLAAALERSPHETVVFFIDLNRFKPVNDTHGHAAGDAVLQELANRLAQLVRPEDSVGRIGGDEFVVLCPGVPTESAESKIRERIEEALRTPVEFAEGVWKPSASIGSARGDADDDVRSLLCRADRHMYEIKRSSSIGAGRRRRATPDPSSLTGVGPTG